MPATPSVPERTGQPPPPRSAAWAPADGKLDHADIADGEARILALINDAVGAGSALDVPGLAARATELARNSLAASTRAGYISAWHQFETWCATYGLSPLPAATETVLLYLASCTLDEGALAASTITVHLSAINKAHVLSRYPAPGLDPAVNTLMRGIRRTLGTRVKRATPVRIQELRRIIAAIDMPDDQTLRDTALLTVGHDLQLNAWALARLQWNDIADTADGAHLTVQLPKSVVTVRARPDDPTCPVAAVRAWRQRLAGTSPYFIVPITGGVTRTDRHISYQSVNAVIGRHLRILGRTGVTLTGLRRRDMRTVIGAVTAPKLIAIRDRALLLLGFATALRRSNLAQLRWSDLEFTPEGIVVEIRSSKTDQVGAGDVLGVPPGIHPETCPVTAVIAWRDALTAATGARPPANSAVFRSIDRHGTVNPGICTANGSTKTLAMSGQAIADVGARHAHVAGLSGRYSGHSLRRGYITTAAEAGKSLEAIARQSRHKRLEVLRQYIERADQFFDHPSDGLGL